MNPPPDAMRRGQEPFSETLWDGWAIAEGESGNRRAHLLLNPQGAAPHY